MGNFSVPVSSTVMELPLASSLQLEQPVQKGSSRCLVCPRLQLVSECCRRFTYAFVALLIATSSAC